MTVNDCQRVIELLPWFERGTLAEEERLLVARHLETCADCRRELDETRRGAWITGQHLPAAVLADLACDLEADASWPREEIQAHLELCPSCRDELATARGASPAPALRFPDPRPQQHRPQRFWKPLALAASLVATLATASLLWQRHPPTAEIATGGALVELLPESYRTRDGSEAATMLDRERSATLLLVTLAVDPANDGAALRALLTAAEGRVVHRVEDLVADDAGTVVLHVPAGALPAGSVEVDLQTIGPSGWATIETFRLDMR